MVFINLAFHIVSLLLALLASSLLLWVNEDRRHSTRLLSFILILFALQNLVFILLFSGLMKYVPWLLRVPAPTTFLLGPLVYLYVRAVLRDEMKLSKWDWLLFIPAFLVLLNFLPYYLLTDREKIDYLNSNFYNKTQGQDPGMGWLPSTIYYIIRICWSGIFILLGFRLIYQFRKRNTGELVANNKVLLNWLTSFISLLATIWVVTILRLFIPTLKNSRFSVADIMLGATILFTCLQLFFRPQILYGVFQPLSKSSPGNEKNTWQALPLIQNIPGEESIKDITNKPAITNNELAAKLADQLKNKNLVESLFREKKPFLQPDYSLDQLVKDTQIPRYTLSAFINREYGMGFREFLNRHRVEYLQANLDNLKWERYTLEAIAMECGFASRITFSKNFKWITGKTPSEYVRDRHQKQSSPEP
jgi:AraC-like DNA-binding protein